MQGVWRASTSERFKAKKELVAALAEGMDRIYIESTSVIGNEYDGRLDDAPNGKYYVVGPDPYTSRKWYAKIVVSGSVDEGTRKAVIS